VPTRYNSPGKYGIGCPVLECEVLIAAVCGNDVAFEFGVETAIEPRPRRVDVEALPFPDLRGGSF
jgi:hypothetical protein